VEELLHQDARVLAPERLHGARVLEKTHKCGIWRRESVNRRKGGEEFPVQLASVVVRNTQKESLGTATICEDITERKKNEQKIHQLAYYDPLTGLPNRALFLDRLQKALASTDRSRQAVAVLFLDLDNFKDINDRHGHGVGDAVLTATSHCLQAQVRPYDHVYRYGGEEFLVSMPQITLEAAVEVAERLRASVAALEIPTDAGGAPVRITASFGLAALDATPPVEESIDRADRAMHSAKTAGRNRVEGGD
jgi:diguanylate cyclase (GGDEF)-like protein